MLAGSALIASPAGAAERLIVRFDGQTGSTERAGAIRAANARTAKTLVTGAQVVVAPDSADARRRLSRDPRVAGVETDHPVSAAAAAPNDPAFGSLWGLLNTGQTVRAVAGAAGEDLRALDAWDRTRGAGSTVAVLDTGTDLSITDLHVNAWSNPGETAANGLDDDGNGKVDDTTGWSFTSDSHDVADDHGHGTHVAGTAVAAADNSQGIAGVAPQARLMTVKVLAADGSGWASDIADGFDYAARQGAQVVNASLGGAGWSSYLRDAIARHPDVMLVAAAGNDAVDVDSSPQYPCAYDLPNVVCVAAHDNTGTLSSFSNFGALGVDLAAPGRDVLSWTPGGTLAYMSGTSMAAPHVAGAAALAASANPGTTPEALRDALIETARRSSALDGSSVSGGALDAAALLDAPPADPGTPPIVLTAPVLTGQPMIGQTLTADGAAFDGATSTGWRWEACRTDGGGCQTVSGESSRTLRVGTALRGRRVRTVAVATNSAGEITTASALTAPVTDPPPSVLSAPRILGDAVVGIRLLGDLGTWVNGAPDRIWFQRCTSDGASCALAGHGADYVVGPADVGRRLRIVVRASGPGGASTATSAPTASVVAAGPVDRRPRLRLTAVKRRTHGRRAVLRIRGRASLAGRVRVGICRRDARRDCRGAGATVTAGRWRRTVRLGRRFVSGRLRVRVTLVARDGSRASVRRTIR